MNSRRSLLTGLATFAAFLIFIPVAFSAEPPPPELDWLPPQGRPGGYLGSESCRECHKNEHASWHRSYHRTMTQYAGSDTVKADFNNVRLTFRGETFTLERQGEQYWVKIGEDTAAPVKKPEAEEGVRLPIGMLTGAHHMQAFWLPTGFGNAQLGFPFTWLVEEKRWVPREAVFLRDPTLPPPKEIWNQTCIRCHSTAPQPRPDKEAEMFRTRVAEMGISCEACHGPAEKHVTLHRQRATDKLPPLKAPDNTIVQPQRLSHERSSQVCGQCHSMKHFDATTPWLQEGFAYRPGDDLEKTTPVMRPKKIADQPWLKKAVDKSPGLLDDFFWKDGMIRVSGREYNGLLESPCNKSEKFSCLSCHSMHDSDPNDQLAKGMDGNQACLQCHDSIRKDIPAHTRHAAASPGSSCYNCHMPHTTYGLLKAMRSHQISSPSAAESRETGRPNACNLCHLDKPLAWTVAELQRWRPSPAPSMNREEREVPAAAVWLLKGDAGQRALAAWHFGWAPAQQASGRDWMAPLLAPLLNDPYAAVRYLAHRSLRTLPETSGFDFDFTAPETVRVSAPKAAAALWKQAPLPAGLSLEAIPKMLQAQDARPIHLRE